MMDACYISLIGELRSLYLSVSILISGPQRICLSVVEEVSGTPHGDRQLKKLVSSKFIENEKDLLRIRLSDLEDWYEKSRVFYI